MVNVKPNHDDADDHGHDMTMAMTKAMTMNMTVAMMLRIMKRMMIIMTLSMTIAMAMVMTMIMIMMSISDGQILHDPGFTNRILELRFRIRLRQSHGGFQISNVYLNFHLLCPYHKLGQRTVLHTQRNVHLLYP